MLKSGIFVVYGIKITSNNIRNMRNAVNLTV